MKNLTHLLTGLYFILLPAGVFSQSSFINTYTQANPSTDDAGTAMTNDYSGNIYITGVYNNSLLVKKFDATLTPVAGWNPTLNFPNTVGYDIDFYNNNLYITAASEYEIVLIKLDVTTQQVVGTLNGYSPDLNHPPRAYSATVNDAGYTIIGSFNNWLDFSGALFIEDNNLNSETNLFLAKFDLNLGENWLTYIPSSTDAAGYSISTVEVGGASYFSYITGYFARNGSPVGTDNISFPGVPTLYTTGGNDIFIAKFQNLNVAPNFTWAKKAGGSLQQTGPYDIYRQDRGYAICATASGDCWLTGQCKGSATFGTTPVLQCGGSTTQFAFVAKYSNSGTCTWSRFMGGCTTTGGNRIGAAIFCSSVLFVSGTTDYLNNPGKGAGIYVGKYNLSNGNTIWESIGWDKTSALYWDRIGLGMYATTCDLYLTGIFANDVRFGLADIQLLQAPGNEEYFVSRLATNGNVSMTTPDCGPGPFTLLATNGVSYLWSTGAPTSSITVSPTVATSYSVIVTSGSCSRTISATVHPSYPANAGPNKDVACPGPPTCSMLGTVLPGNPTYTWTPTTGLTCTNCATPYTCYTTTYTVTVKYDYCPSTTDQVLTYADVGCRTAGSAIESNSGVRIDPNPSDGLFHIEGLVINTPVFVYAIDGRLINKFIPGESQYVLDLTTVEKGIYLITDGNSFKQKIILN